jgi:hypothetical protein
MAAITDIQQSIRIPADSQIIVTTGGLWWSGQLSDTGLYIDNGDGTVSVLAQNAHTAFVSIYRKSDGVAVLTQQPMVTWLASPGCYKTVIDAAVCQSGSFPYRRIVEIFGSGGTSDTLFATFRADYVESDGSR